MQPRSILRPGIVGLALVAVLASAAALACGGSGNSNSAATPAASASVAATSSATDATARASVTRAVATNTPAPATPTATATPVPPTATPVPPTPALTAPADALALMNFQSPSGNIACQLFPREGQSAARAECQLSNTTFDPPANPDPGGCHGAGAWGKAIGMDGGGEPGFMCVGDYWGGPDVTVLAYGQTAVMGPFACKSMETGMRCVDLDTGHGFQVAREAYQLF